MVIQGTRLVFFNRQARQILELETEEMKTLVIRDIVHPDDWPSVAQRLGRREQGEDLVAETEFRLRLANGKQKWVGTRSSTALWEGRYGTMTFFSDITERRQAMEALHRSEERYRAVVEHVGEGMVVVRGTDFVFANQQAADLVEMPLEEMLAKGYLHRIHPDDRAMVDERRQKRLRGEPVPSRYEIRLLLPGNKVRWLDIGVTIVPWNGELATLTFFSDVTERKDLERKFKETLEEREIILETSVVGIAFLTHDGRFIWCNRAMLGLFGALPNDGLRSIESIYQNREQYLAVGGQAARAIQAGESFQTEIQLKRFDGRKIWVNMSGNAVRPRDLSQGTVWVLQDISRRKELEAQLEMSSKEREAILSNTLVGMVFSVGRRHGWVNGKYASMLGYAPEELIGRSSEYLYETKEEWQEFGRVSRESLRATGMYVVERKLTRKDGSSFWVHMAGSCLKERDPDSGIVWSFLDITERKQAEEDTRQALVQQIELNQLRSRFVAMTSHEFRTPLASILSSAELLRHYGSRMQPDEQVETLQTIEASVQRMTNMLERILLIGKSEEQLLECKPSQINLRLLCQHLVQEAHKQYPHTACQLVLDWQAGQQEMAVLDEKLLRHIFGNLLSNAIKYSPQGGSVKFIVRQVDKKWAFEVSDQGIGIPAGEMGHLFQTFHRASNVEDIAGTGLGLAIVKRSVETHGGKIEVTSEQGRGTRFEVRL
jgi:PAS domain S-box-containing protein